MQGPLSIRQLGFFHRTHTRHGMLSGTALCLFPPKTTATTHKNGYTKRTTALRTLELTGLRELTSAEGGSGQGGRKSSRSGGGLV